VLLISGGDSERAGGARTSQALISWNLDPMFTDEEEQAWHNSARGRRYMRGQSAAKAMHLHEPGKEEAGST
jgi:hypothetical protein